MEGKKKGIWVRVPLALYLFLAEAGSLPVLHEGHRR